MKCTVIIPARLKSKRLPNKLLLRETGKTVLEHTFDCAAKCNDVSRIIVATDDDQIEEVAKRFAEVIRTASYCKCGTERVAEIVMGTKIHDEVVVNLQGDQVAMPPEFITRLLKESVREIEEGRFEMATLSAPFTDEAEFRDHDNVKTIITELTLDRLPGSQNSFINGRAAYFSRMPMPFFDGNWLNRKDLVYQHHVGIYSYSHPFLKQFARMPESTLEQLERLEQLRAIEAGYRIAVGVVGMAPLGINNSIDYGNFIRTQTGLD